MRQLSGDLKEISVNVKNGFLVLQFCINVMNCLREMRVEKLSLLGLHCFLAVVLLWLLILNIAVIAFSFAALPN